MKNQLIRKDLKIIAGLIKEKSCVLDIGCGDGEFLQFLQDNKKINGRGIEISQEQVKKALSKGLSVVCGNAENDLSYYADKSFEYAILNQFIQTTNRPDNFLQEVLRVAKYAVISLPNFAYIKNRWTIAVNGSMPFDKSTQYQWYKTPNIHSCSIKDFINFCKKFDFKIEKEFFLSGKNCFNIVINNRIFANLFAEYGVFLITKSQFSATFEAEFALKKMLFEQKAVPQFV